MACSLRYSKDDFCELAQKIAIFVFIVKQLGVCLLKYFADYEKIAVVVFRFQYADKKPSLGEAKKYSGTITAIAKYKNIYGCTVLYINLG
jgi:hypothetical protein